ncbi:hypothetical protein [Muricoccus nepalensis]|uniref:hypothetical protein n=1 Tax=Muricoccus nepalensis TaxID=1854500 RepID=UPI00112C9546|nr:hypothetical protein [Roseomonas nepalensis]
MPGQRGTERRQLSGQVLVRLPDGTHDALRAAAAAAGLTDAAWVRAQLVDALGTEAPDAVPIARYQPPKAPRPEWLADLDAARETAAELTGALVRAAAISRLAGDHASHADIEALIPGTRRAARDAAHTIRRVCRHIDGELPGP